MSFAEVVGVPAFSRGGGGGGDNSGRIGDDGLALSFGARLSARCTSYRRGPRVNRDDNDADCDRGSNSDTNNDDRDSVGGALQAVDTDRLSRAVDDDDSYECDRAWSKNSDSGDSARRTSEDASTDDGSDVDDSCGQSLTFVAGPLTGTRGTVLGDAIYRPGAISRLGEEDSTGGLMLSFAGMGITDADLLGLLPDARICLPDDDHDDDHDDVTHPCGVSGTGGIPCPARNTSPSGEDAPFCAEDAPLCAEGDAAGDNEVCDGSTLFERRDGLWPAPAVLVDVRRGALRVRSRTRIWRALRREAVAQSAPETPGPRARGPWVVPASSLSSSRAGTTAASAVAGRIERYALARLEAHVRRQAKQCRLRRWAATLVVSRDFPWTRSSPLSDEHTVYADEHTVYADARAWRRLRIRSGWLIAYTTYYAPHAATHRGFNVVQVCDRRGRPLQEPQILSPRPHGAWRLGYLEWTLHRRAGLDVNEEARRVQDGPLRTRGTAGGRRSETRTEPAGTAGRRRRRTTTLYEAASGGEGGGGKGGSEGGGGGGGECGGGEERAVFRASTELEVDGSGRERPLCVTAETLAPDGEAEVRAATDRDNRVTVELLRPYPDGRVYGYKAARTADGKECLVKLYIPDDARVAFSDDDPKCRADVAVVARIVSYAYRRRDTPHTRRSIYVDSSDDDSSSDDDDEENDDPNNNNHHHRRRRRRSTADAANEDDEQGFMFEGQRYVDVPADSPECGHLEYLDGAVLEAFSSVHREPFRYAVGETVRATDYDPDLAKTCVPGIHFCWTQEEALRWNAVFATRDDLDGFDDLRERNDPVFELLHGAPASDAALRTSGHRASATATTTTTTSAAAADAAATATCTAPETSVDGPCSQ